jgi:hypothetical protein
MTLSEFKSSLKQNSPPVNINELLIALWHDAKVGPSKAGASWEKAHKIVQNINGKDAAWIHAYLHRKEGDSSNASYWYSRAGKEFSDKTLDEEWEEIVRALLKR